VLIEGFCLKECCQLYRDDDPHDIDRCARRFWQHPHGPKFDVAVLKISPNRLTRWLLMNHFSCQTKMNNRSFGSRKHALLWASLKTSMTGPIACEPVSFRNCRHHQSEINPAGATGSRARMYGALCDHLAEGRRALRHVRRSLDHAPRVGA
jgi:hypothetical protein